MVARSCQIGIIICACAFLCECGWLVEGVGQIPKRCMSTGFLQSIGKLNLQLATSLVKGHVPPYGKGHPHKSVCL